MASGLVVNVGGFIMMHGGVKPNRVSIPYIPESSRFYCKEWSGRAVMARWRKSFQ